MTLCTCTLARDNVNSSGFGSGLRAMVIFTGVPTRPRMRSMVSLRFSEFTGTSSTARIRSPASTPARNAGVSSIGVMTLTTPFSSATSMPTPEYSPVVLMRISSNCSGSRNAECGSRSAIRPRIAASISSWSEMFSTYSRRTCSSTSASSRASCHGTGDVAVWVTLLVVGSGSISRSAWTVRPTDRPKPATSPTVRTSAKRMGVPRRESLLAIAESWTLEGGSESIVHGGGSAYATED